MAVYPNIGVEADAATRSDGIAAGAGSHLPIGEYGGADYRSGMRFAAPAGWGAWTAITKATLTFYISDFQHVAPKSSSIYCSRQSGGALWTKAAGSQSCESGFSGGNTTQFGDLATISNDRVTFSSGTTANAAKSIDVTAHVRAYWVMPATKIVFVFDNASAGHYTELWADEKSGKDAVLSIEYETAGPPNAPTLGSPAAGTTTVDDTPTLSWTHNDPQGDAQSSAEVRVWDAAGTTQVGITRTVTGAGNSLAWPVALPRGTTYQWDVRTADAVSGFGPWSAKQAFTVKALPVVTIDPVRYMVFASGAPRLQVKWSSDQPQTHYRVQKTAAPAFDSGWLAGTATSYTLAAVALTDNVLVNVTVSVRSDPFPLEGSSNRNFTPRYGLTTHKKTLAGVPVNWQSPIIVSSVPVGATLQIEYGSAATAGAATPTAWFTALSSLPKPYTQYLHWRAWFIPSATAGPTLDSIDIPYNSTAALADKWSSVQDVPGLSAPFSVDDGEYVYGTRSMRADVTGAGPWVCYSYGIKVRAGRSYILTGLMKSEGNSGALFRLFDGVNNVVTSDSLTATTDWFTPDRRDVNRYKTPVWVADGDKTVWVVLRVGGAAGAQAWFDGIKLEESTVATPWSPAALGATVIDAGGVQVDGSKGGVLRYRGTSGGVRHVAEGGATGLVFGGDTEVDTPIGGMLRSTAPAATNSYIRSQAPAGQRAFFDMVVAGDASARTRISGDATQQGIDFGGGASFDTNLYRSAANVLKTDDQFVSAGGLILPRGGNQTMLAATAIAANAGYVQVTTTGAVVTTAVPTIPAGVDGQMLVIVYAGAGSWQIRDVSSLAGSGVRLSTATYTMGDRDTLTLMWMATAAGWVELSRSVVL
jgi:hypothetical protein